MTFNLLVWKWSQDFDIGPKRKKARLKHSAILAGFLEHQSHPAMAEHDLFWGTPLEAESKATALAGLGIGAGCQAFYCSTVTAVFP